MKTWNSLIDTALIGTDKKTLEPGAILPSIRDFLTAETESQRLLDAASLTHFYSKGVVRAQTAPINSSIEIEETLPVTTPEQQALLQDILFVEHPWSADLLGRWISRITAQGYRVNPVQLTRLLEGIRKGKGSIPPEQTGILGEIGKYVARRFELIKPGIFLTEEERFLQASLSEIREDLMRLREQDRPAFVSRLEQHWKTFPLNEQLHWVCLLRDLPSEEELRFAQQLWENEFPPKAKETVNYTRIRSHLAASLLSRTSDTFYRETLTALQAYCSKQSKGFFGKLLKSGPEKQIELPAAEDDFLNETVFHERFGLIIDKQIKDVSEERLRAYFRHLVAILPFQSWTELLECSSEQAFHYFREDKAWQQKSGGQSSWELDEAFREIAEFTHDENFLTLFGTLRESRNYSALLRLPSHSMEKILDQADLACYELIDLFANHEGPEFSPSFAVHVLKKTLNHYQQSNFYKLNGFDRIFPLLPAEALSELEKQIHHTGDFTGKAQWMQDIGTPLLEYLKLKQRIEKTGL